MSTRRSSVTHPRGRLPARVYWIRRSLVVATALVLVVGFAQLLGSIGGGSSPSAATLSAKQSPTQSPSSGTPSAPSTPAPSTAAPALATPSGPCDLSKLSVTPVVSVAHAANPVTIALKVTGSAPACTFEASAKSLAVKIVSGQDRVWSSQDCPSSVARRTVIVRSGAEATVPVVWGGRRSDGTCSNTNKWALPGYYHVIAAVMGSTPTDTQFQLTVAPRAVITKTAKPRPQHKSTASATPGATPSKTASKAPAKNSGTHGKGSACGGDNAAGTC